MQWIWAKALGKNQPEAGFLNFNHLKFLTELPVPLILIFQYLKNKLIAVTAKSIALGFC